MIPVSPQPEPHNFAINVRGPGRTFLRGLRGRTPNKKQWANNRFWKLALDDLNSAYGGICAYSAIWVPTQCSVDHYHPKSLPPFERAYEWSNFRLASREMNAFKGDSTQVLDPFNVQTGWFALDFTTFEVSPGDKIATNIATAVSSTIHILRLNDDAWVQQRFEIVRDYSQGHTNLAFLERRYPFIACELRRQSLHETIVGTIA